ncbi:hypothetical protein [Ponticaulis profundi]|uniref:Uncharacterized protein n=1 Tax=Ponticaulis profundi TaxID=2665222 RepID=A0ABW1SC81_9PROT
MHRSWLIRRLRRDFGLRPGGMDGHTYGRAIDGLWQNQPEAKSANGLLMMIAMNEVARPGLSACRRAQAPDQAGG